MTAEVRALVYAVERMAGRLLVRVVSGIQDLRHPVRQDFLEVCAAADLVKAAQRRAQLAPPCDVRQLLIADAYARRN